ncbi:MAG: PhoH family protein [Solirubrobacterales bacterium]|nr:PhoH family protein [Solirubrobacterales bacterium]MBV9809347.1 PhoH family protein [Solirubrobacterales bacterium]
MRRQIELENAVAAELAGSKDAVLRALEGHLDCDVFLRGNVLTLDGEAEAVDAAAAVVRELSELILQGHEIAPGTIEAVKRALDAHESPGRILEDVVWRHRATKVSPKTVNQKRYVDSIRTNTITFGIGPAGTGKTFLAVALAAAALSRREVNRIILTRPAVEAGERLGFLPGDLMAKVDPYLRPLFDALHDMLEPERVSSHLERGVIEVAPLAFMRGRAQPISTPVLTPAGFRPIGNLRIGDLVTGSNGSPTPVLGVYPQGRKQVFRVTAQDGASTLCCGEHLWHVFAASDRRRGQPGRVLETRQMMGRLRSFHQHRYELPLLSAPAEFPQAEVPIDPYALGLLLGDGCLTTRTTATFSTLDPELAFALEDALEGVELRRKGYGDYTLRHVHGHRGGVIVANPVTAALRRLGLAGTTSGTKFIPEAYLHNSSEVRIGVLQGLLDTDGGPVTQRGRTCRIQYTTCSERLRDDVAYLVRSLGGVAYCRRRKAHGRPPGRVNGRPVEYRHDAFVMDIRMPAGIEPFRLTRKREIYDSKGGGRPMRFIDSIEPAGAAECVCIQIAAADSLYVAEDFLVTHNTLNDSFIILDEAQNTSPEQMKMFLTRLGFNSKMVVTGDITQIDLPREQDSGLVVVADILKEVEGIEFVRFGEEDVVRHKLVRRIVAAYNEHGQRLAPELRPRAATPRG